VVASGLSLSGRVPRWNAFKGGTNVRRRRITGQKVTQSDIAKRVGLDVSSVNKILNFVEGPVFKNETRAQVLSVAKELGYDFNRPTRSRLLAALKELVPLDVQDDDLALRLKVTVWRVDKLKTLIYGRSK
jgi:transcriptional regulator with XRE-family HTH domain